MGDPTPFGGSRPSSRRERRLDKDRRWEINRRGRSPDSLGVQHAVRRPRRGQRYHLPIRMSDAFTGRRDGRHDGLVAVAASSRPAPPVEPVPLVDAGTLPFTLWLLRNQHTFDDRDQREYLATQAALADVRASLHALYADADRLTRDLAAARDRRATFAEEPDEKTLHTRGSAERYDSEITITTRRRREHQRRVAAVDAEVAALERNLADVLRQVHAKEGVLLTAFDIAITRSRRLRALHERRAAVYRRWHRRAWRWSTRRLSPHPEWPLYSATTTIPVPEWTTQSCPWVRPPSHPAPVFNAVG